MARIAGTVEFGNQSAIELAGRTFVMNQYAAEP
jgi:hypothetical protein